MYDFFLYSGLVNSQKYSGSYVVLRLIETQPKYQNYKKFFDDDFLMIPLCLALKDSRYLPTAIIRANRTKGCPLLAPKDLRKQGRGSYCSE